MNKDCVGFDMYMSQHYTNHFEQIFQEFDTEKYTWYVLYSDNLISENSVIGEFLPDGVYSGKDFSEIIKEKEYYII